MITNSALSQAILAFLCYSEEHAEELSIRVDPSLFLTRVHRRVAETAIEHIAKYRKPPGEQIQLLLEMETKRGDEGKLLIQILEELANDFKLYDGKFILDQLEDWEKSQRITDAAQKAIEAVSRGDVKTAEDLIYNSQVITRPEETQGIWLNNPVEMFRSSETQSDEFFSSGVKAIDNLGLRPERKTLTCWMASTGKGKSWALINTLRGAVQHGHTAIYITLELSQEKVARRLLQNLFSLTKSEAQAVRTPFFRSDGDSFVLDFRELRRDSVVSKRKDIAKLLTSGGWPRIHIKEFPTGMLSFRGLNVYLDQLAKNKNFTPDIIIIDQADNMEVDAEMLRIALGRLYVSLRGMAVERNACVITATQGNREGEDAKTMDKRHVSEDWSKMGTVDACYAYSQTSAEYNTGLSRILVAKYRDEADRVMILNAQNYTIGQFSLDSTIMARNVAVEVARMTGTE